MTKTPELLWKVRIDDGARERFEYVTTEVAQQRGLYGQVLALGAEHAYVRVGPQTFTPYQTWKRQNRR